MATVTHIIRSYYDPADREQLERETGQRTETSDDDGGPSSDPWQTESTFSAQRRIRAAPTFVPATISYDERGASVPLGPSLSLSLSSSTTGAGAGTESGESDQLSTASAVWYRSLIAAAAAKNPRESATAGKSPPQSSLSSPSSLLSLRPSSAPTRTGTASSTHPSTEDVVKDTNARPPRHHRAVPSTKHDWFIHNALRSDPSLSHTHTSPSGSRSNNPGPSLADLLARDPPPLPRESRYVPPVWLHIGPSNKGFGMLQRCGWREGEGLGSHVVQRKNTVSSSSAVAADNAGRIDQAHEVIDLTRSDSEVSENEDIFEQDAVRSDSMETEAVASRNVSASHMQRSLLTPLPTVLKADRLGIGLKAKTEGPYKQSKKRVTHGAAALAVHIRAAEEIRRKKAEVGRGRRGFAKAHKREEDRRKRMLAYLNE